jgi:hypothetical protein
MSKLSKQPLVAVLLLLSWWLPGAAGAGPLGPEVLVGNARSSDPNGTPPVAVAAFADGGFVVVWNAPDTLRARLFDRHGAPASGEIPLVRPFGQDLDAVAALPNGFVVVWEQQSSQHAVSVYARVFNRSGAPLGPPFKVNGNSSYDRCCGLVAATPGGGFAVSWSAFAGTPDDSGYTDAVLSRFFDARGRPLGPPPQDPILRPSSFPLDLVFPTAAGVGTDGALTTVIYDQGDQVNLLTQRVDQTGAAVGGGPVNPSDPDLSDGYWAVLGAAGSAILPAGDFYVAWVSTFACLPAPHPCTSFIFAQHFASSGDPVGPPLAVSDHGYATVGGPLLLPLAVLPQGGFLALWNAIPKPPGPGDFNVGPLFARGFDVHGNAIGEEFQVSFDHGADAWASALAAGPGGDALAVWLRINGRAWSVYARLLRP